MGAGTVAAALEGITYSEPQQTDIQSHRRWLLTEIEGMLQPGRSQCPGSHLASQQSQG